MSQPKLLPKPWASEGLKNSIPTTRSSSLAQESATYVEGFPSITMTPISVGGKPPSGKDMNGILNEISAHTVYLNRGERYRFDAAFCTAIGGYPRGAILMNDGGTAEYISLIDRNTANFNNAAVNISGKWAIYAGEGTIKPATATVAGVSKLIDRLDSTDTTAALSAAQGKALNDNKLGNNGVQTLSGSLTINIPNQWEKLRFTTKSGWWRFETNPEGDNSEGGKRFNYVFTGGDGTEKSRIAFEEATGKEIVAYQSWVKTQNANNVQLSGNQTINGVKTFSGDTVIQAALTVKGAIVSGDSVTVSGANKTARMGVGSGDVYIHNPTSNKYLQLGDDGVLRYSNNPIYHSGYKPSANDVGALPTTGGTLTDKLTIRKDAAGAHGAGINLINNGGGANAGVHVDAHLARRNVGGIHWIDKGNYSANAQILTTPNGNSAERRELHTEFLANGGISVKGYGLLHDYFAIKSAVHLKNRYANTHYPNHYKGAEVYKIPTRDDAGIMITVLRAYVNPNEELILPEAYAGFFVPIMVDAGGGRVSVSCDIVGNNKVKAYVPGRLDANLIVIGYANF